MKHFLPAIRFTIFMTLLLGFAYPLLITGIAETIFSRQASGDFVSRGGVIVGSLLIGQKFEKPEYFWPRPSTVDYNPLPSGGSNLGQANQDLKKTVDERKERLKAAHSEQEQPPPQDLLFASASGLDPHISVEATQYQVARVAKARNLTKAEINQLVEQASEGRQFGLFGEPTVNVLALNLALDKKQGSKEPRY